MKEVYHCLGINISDQGSAVILRDGQVIVAISEDRLDKGQSWLQADDSGFFFERLPQKAIAYCMEAAQIEYSDLDDVVVSGTVVYHSTKSARNPVHENIAAQLPDVPKKRITLLNHHLAHACSAYFMSPYDASVVFVADGIGNICGNRKNPLGKVPDLEHTTAFLAKRNVIGEIFKVTADAKGMNSLGALYHLVTRHIGFDDNGQEKTMALAQSGSDKLLPIFSKALKHDDEGGYIIAPDFQPQFGKGRFYHHSFTHSFKAERTPDQQIRDQDRDMAFAAQKVLEDYLVHAAKSLFKHTRVKNLCLAGGVAKNIKANTKIAAMSGFENCFVTPFSGDDGVALGAALWAWMEKCGMEKREVPRSNFWGISYSDRQILQVIEGHSDLVVAQRTSDPAFEAAQMLSEGKIIGWFQGGAEFGKGGLGHRCILADPTKLESLNRINKHIRYQEEFIPGTLAILEGRAKDYLEVFKPSHWGMFESKVLNPDLFKGATQPDGFTSTITVTPEYNGKEFHELVRAFESITNIPAVLSTELSLSGKPLAESPADAIQCLLDSGMDAMVIGQYLVFKRNRLLTEKIALLKKENREKEKALIALKQELKTVKNTWIWKLIHRIFDRLNLWKREQKPTFY